MQTHEPLLDDSSNSDIAALQQAAARIQASGVLGEARLRNLFDYLASKTLAGESPKEITIAMEVFGKTPDFDVSQDALVRVYIHKLRKALEGFYASDAAAEAGAALHIPRGEYRLRVNTRPSIAPGSRSWVKDSRLQLLIGSHISMVRLDISTGLA